MAGFDTQEHDMLKVMGEFIAAYPTAYQTLLEERPFTCAKTGKSYDAVPAPIAIIMDVRSPWSNLNYVSLNVLLHIALWLSPAARHAGDYW